VRVKREPRETAVTFYQSPYPIFQETLSSADVVDENTVELTLRLRPGIALQLVSLLINGQGSMRSVK
jgi:hypothetical protein